MIVLVAGGIIIAAVAVLAGTRTTLPVPSRAIALAGLANILAVFALPATSATDPMRAPVARVALACVFLSVALLAATVFRIATAREDGRRPATWSIAVLAGFPAVWYVVIRLADAVAGLLPAP